MKKIVLLLLVSLAFIGCNYECGDYPQFMSDYMPYHKDQVVSFRNDKGDVMDFKVQFTYIEQSKSMQINCTCTCDGMKEVVLNNQMASDSIREIELWFYTLIKKRNVGDGLALNCFFYNDTVSFDYNCLGRLYYRKTGFDPYKDKNSDKVPLVLEMTNDNNKVSRVKIERGKGVVEFDDRMNNCTWKLVE